MKLFSTGMLCAFVYLMGIAVGLAINEGRISDYRFKEIRYTAFLYKDSVSGWWVSEYFMSERTCVAYVSGFQERHNPLRGRCQPGRWTEKRHNSFMDTNYNILNLPAQ